jgi:nucleotidyltransferase substrate binding protein (TIGR01987 family)
VSDVRWKQRFESYRRALERLRQPVAGGVERLSQLEKEGLIQRFEFTFELAWKTLKDYLVYQGVSLEATTPRHTIKAAFAAGIIADGQLWIDMLESRNVMSHQYDEARFLASMPDIVERFLPALETLRKSLESKVDE